MTDPKIRYDIEANATGEADVARLAAQLAKLDEALDPQVAAQAKQLGAELEALGGKRAAIQTFMRSLVDANEAGRKLEETSSALQRLERSLEGVAAPTRAQAGQLQKLRDAAAQAQTAFQNKTATLNDARTTLDRYGISATNLDGAEDRLAASMRTTAGEAQRLVGSYQQTAAAATSAGRSQEQFRTQLQGLGEQLRTVQTLAATAIGGGLLGGVVGDVARTADEFANLSAKVRLVTGDGADFQNALQGVQAVALRTNSDLDATATLFARLAEAGKEVGLSQQNALALTETINQSIQLSGGSAESAKAAITQLIQGLQSGVLRGEEFNSVVEQSPRLAKALADGLGVARGELRELANQGRLTADVVIQALQGQSEAVQTEFEKLPPTVGRALQNLSTAWTVYIGQTDAASGASATAAKAISLLADNLGTLANLLLDAGQAAAAFAAVRLAQNFLGLTAATSQAAAAKKLETAATVENTAAQAANTSATLANAGAKAAAAAAGARAAAASEAAAASAGRFAAALSTIKTFSLLAVVTNFQDIGKWVGETAAKLMGYGKQLELAEQLARADAEASRVNAAQKAALADQARKAAEAALGLNKEAKALVGQFEDLTRKGDTATEALGKLGKSLNLGDVQGITAAGAALDALALKGKITGEQVREALAGALKGIDLGVFQANAEAAFDGTEQGARRLRAAIDAIALESLTRVGTSLRELETGFSAAASSAINDVEKLDKALQALGAEATTTSRLLATSLDKALQSATTERAVRAVIERFVELGQQGRIAGDALTAGLEKARAKLDELRPGINSLSEALKSFGIKTREELQATATRLGDSYKLIANSVTVSLADKIKAFAQYREAAIAANGGVESSEVQLQRRVLELQADARGLGEVFATAMGKAKSTTDAATESQERLATAAKKAKDLIEGLGAIGPSQDGVNFGIRSPGTAAARDAQGNLPKIDSYGDLIRNTPGTGITRTGGSQFAPPDNSGGWYFDSEAYNKAVNGIGPGGKASTVDPARFWTKNPSGLVASAGLLVDPYGQTSGGLVAITPLSPAAEAAKAQAANQAAGTTGLSAQEANLVAAQNARNLAGQAPASSSSGFTSASAGSSSAGSSYTINVTIGTRTTSMNAASQADADRMLAALEEAWRAGGGGV